MKILIVFYLYKQDFGVSMMHIEVILTYLFCKFVLDLKRKWNFHKIFLSIVVFENSFALLLFLVDKNLGSLTRHW